MSQLERSGSPLIAIKCLVIVLCVGGLVSLQSFNYYAQHAPPAGGKVNLAAGEKLFSGACSNAYCHGSGGAGGGAPALVNRDLTPEYVKRVIANGIPGSNMPAFKNRFKEDQIAGLTNYVLSLSPNRAKTSNATTDDSNENSAANAVRTPSPIAKSAAMLAEEEAGRALFFGSIEGCHTCHSYNNKGGKVGPDLLARVGDKSIKEITDLITNPRGSSGESFTLLSVTTNDGRRVSGIKRDENPEYLRIYDASSLPPVSRVILKSDIAKTDRLDLAAVHKPFVTKYSPKELQQLAAYLKSAAPE